MGPIVGTPQSSRYRVDKALLEAIDDRFDELNQLSMERRGRRIEKSRDYYPAVFEVAFSNQTGMDVLGLKKE